MIGVGGLGKVVGHCLAELTGTVSHVHYTAFCMIPYHSKSMKQIKVTEFLDKEVFTGIEGEASND